MSSSTFPPQPESLSASADDPSDAVRQAWVLIQQQRYSEVAACLAEAEADDLNVAVPTRLALNLAALEAHRPEVLSKLVEANPLRAIERYPLTATPSGHAIPAKASRDGRVKPLSGNPDPQAAAAEAMQQLEKHIRDGQPIAFADVIDGYMLSQLAQAKPTLPVGQQQAIYLIERDPLLLIACLMLHDWTGEDGPIADPRFSWFVGPSAQVEFTRQLTRDRMLLPPQIVLGRERPRAALGRLLERYRDHAQKREALWASRIDGHYADYECKALTVGLPTRPRILLITSRFTTVLKHSIADCEQAFRRLGWRTQVLIEPTDVHRITSAAIRRVLAKFRPDVVFTIDHLRSHSPEIFPDKLPYVCWIQDQLPQFTTHEAGDSIGLRDFVLSMVGPMYTQQWGYPARQIIEVPKLTRPPIRPKQWASDGHDLVYVSSASQRPEALLEQLAGDEKLVVFGQAVAEVYRTGGCLPTMWDMGQLIDRVCDAGEVTLTPAERAVTINRLFHPLNNALYRQQVLGWVAQAADDLGLDLALYGHGWESHPDFARFAKGQVAYGPDLEQLTRDSKINLQIVPSFCLHQRMLDGLVAGGFFLAYEHPSDTLMPSLLKALDGRSQSVEQALEYAGSGRGKLEGLLAEAECLTDLGMPVDLVAWLRGCRRSELLNDTGVALPRLDEISFRDAAGLRQRLETFMDDGPLRQELAEAQRLSVEQRLSYTAGLRRTLSRIGRLLADEKHLAHHKKRGQTAA